MYSEWLMSNTLVKTLFVSIGLKPCWHPTELLISCIHLNSNHPKLGGPGCCYVNESQHLTGVLPVDGTFTNQHYQLDFVFLRTQRWTLERTWPFSQWALRMLKLPRSSLNSTFPPALNSKHTTFRNIFCSWIQWSVCFDGERDLWMQSVTPHGWYSAGFILT